MCDPALFLPSTSEAAHIRVILQAVSRGNSGSQGIKEQKARLIENKISLQNN